MIDKVVVTIQSVGTPPPTLAYSGASWPGWCASGHALFEDGLAFDFQEEVGMR